MITNTNLTLIQGNLVRDAELNDEHGLVTFSVAIDRAGSEKGSENTTGYFDVKMWVRESEYSAAATVKRIKTSFAEGKLTKGARVSIAGRLVQERWEKDGSKNSKIIIVAEDMNIMFTADNTNKVPVGATAGTATKDFDINQF